MAEALTDAGVSAAAGFGTRHTAEEDLQLGIQQSHVFPSKDLRRATGQPGPHHDALTAYIQHDAFSQNFLFSRHSGHSTQNLKCRRVGEKTGQRSMFEDF